MLVYDKIAATDQERGDIEALARQMGMDLGTSWSGGPVPLEYSIERLTCAVASRLDAVMVG